MGLESFQILTDHKPLVPLINNKDISDTPIRCQRLLMRLMRFKPKAVYTPGKEMIVADALSRSPVTGGTVCRQRSTESLTNMAKFGVPPSEIMGFGSDGASVTTGRNKGATGMLLRENPHLINVHCMAHRLALCTSLAADSVAGMKEYHTAVTSLYYYFKKAPARVARFAEIQRILDEDQVSLT